MKMIAAGRVVGVVVALLFLVVCRQGDGARQDTREPNPAVSVEALVVSAGILNPYIDLTGTVSGIQEALVVSETQGVIRSVSFDLGDSLHKGQVLLSVDREVARLAMMQAEQQYRTAQMNLQAAQRLYEDSAISRSELVNMRSAYNGAKASWESARKQYRDTQVRAPINGLVASKEPSAAVGNYLSPGTPVARIVDMSRLKLEVAVGDYEISLLKENAPVKVLVRSTCTDTQFTGRVKALAAGADPSTGSYNVVIELDNPCGRQIRSGMTASISIRTTVRDSSIIVPAQAVLRTSDSAYVFLAEEDTVRRQVVLAGASKGNRVTITEGLEMGDTLVLSGAGALDQGDSVKVTVIGKSGVWE